MRRKWTRRAGRRVGAFGVIAAVGAIIALHAGPASAVPCSVGGTWNPDPTAANMTDCGPGSGATDNDARVTDAIELSTNPTTPNGLTFLLWDQDGPANQTDGTEADDAEPSRDGSFFYTATTVNDEGESLTGLWFWNATTSISEGNTVFALVLKDGSVAGSPSWAWFLLDNANPTTIECLPTKPAAFTHCGVWSMYGNDGTIKGLSHMSMYGAAGPDITQVPNPLSIMLVGIGLVGLGYVTRRRLAK